MMPMWDLMSPGKAKNKFFDDVQTSLLYTGAGESALTGPANNHQKER
jgi:hypothetical protein